MKRGRILELEQRVKVLTEVLAEALQMIAQLDVQHQELEERVPRE